MHAAISAIWPPSKPSEYLIEVPTRPTVHLQQEASAKIKTKAIIADGPSAADAMKPQAMGAAYDFAVSRHRHQVKRRRNSFMSLSPAGRARRHLSLLALTSVERHEKDFIPISF